MAAALGVPLFCAGVVASLAASWLLVSRLERLGERAGFSEAWLGLVAALAADAPEITSAVTALTRGQASVGAGVVIGSNVFNLAALLGLAAVVAGWIGFHRRVVLLAGVPAVWVAAVCLLAVAAVVGPAAGLALTAVVLVPYAAVLGMRRARLEWSPACQAVSRLSSASVMGLSGAACSRAFGGALRRRRHANTIRPAPHVLPADRAIIRRGHRIQPASYLTATRLTGWMSGARASRSADTWASAAGIWPLMCAVRASSVAKVSKMPYLVSLILNAYQVTVPSSATARSRPALRNAASSSPLPALASSSARMPSVTVMGTVSFLRYIIRGPFSPLTCSWRR